MTVARGCVIAFGVFAVLAGIAAIAFGPTQLPGFPAIPALIFGSLLVITAIVEPIYGKLTARPPLSGEWRPTGEKFVDPATGKPVEVWFAPKTGERRYVDVSEAADKR